MIEPIVSAHGGEIPVDEDGAHERDQDRRRQQHPRDDEDGLEVRSSGSRESVQRLDERSFGEDLERPARHRRDHGDTATGHAGEQQIRGAHAHERRLGRDPRPRRDRP